MKTLPKICIVCAFLISACGQGEKSSESKKSTPTIPQPGQLQVFDYKPESPVNGELKAVIELGALGLNYFIIEIDDEARWALKNQAFGRSNIIYGQSTLADILANIRKFKGEILKQGVKNENIHMIISSSVSDSNISTLEESIRTLNIPIKMVNSEEEAKYAFLATIPREFSEESFLVDVGSGNTKLSWMNASDTATLEIHGSKFFLGDVRDTTVFREVRDAVLEVPRENRNLCFILGGIIYEFIKTEIEGQDQRYYVLKTPGSYATDNEKLKAGNIIYSALHLEPTYSYIFDSQSNFSIGYLVSLKK